MKHVSIITMMLLIVIFSNAALAQIDGAALSDFGLIMGVAIDTASNPLKLTAIYSGWHVIALTDSEGVFNLGQFYAGEYDFRFKHITTPYNIDTTIFGVNVAANETTFLNITLLPNTDPYPGLAYFWVGGYFDYEHRWCDTVRAAIDQWLDVPVYFMGGSDVIIENICYPLAIRYDLIDEFDQEACRTFYPLTEWRIQDFSTYNDDMNPQNPNPVGYHSLSFIGFSRFYSADAPLLYSEVPRKILSFRAHTKNDPSLQNLVFTDAFNLGMDWVQGPANAGDSAGEYYFPIFISHACLFMQPHAYLPGDVNMAGGIWPPAALGGDVTYLTGYFRGPRPSCLLDGFWCSADVNGDCNIIGSDVTYLVNVFRGFGSMRYCPNHPPLWPTPADLPAEAPPGWPNCEQR